VNRVRLRTQWQLVKRANQQCETVVSEKGPKAMERHFVHHIRGERRRGRTAGAALEQDATLIPGGLLQAIDDQDFRGSF
jgi:hypothetical protein